MRLALPPVSCKVYTPVDLAEAMVRALGDSSQAYWLEPSHGKGAFVESVARLGIGRERIFAVDLDPARERADGLATTRRGVDFLRWATETNLRFDRIVGNPPFVAINQLPRSLQDAARSVLDLTDRPIGQGANLWYAFLLASIRLLRDGGCLAFVLPSAAEFADYALDMRQRATGTFASVELFRCKCPLFDDVQEGTLVAIARGYGSSPGVVRRRWFRTRKGLIQGLSQSGRLNGRKCPPPRPCHTRQTLTLNSVAKIGLGGVTGHAGYFLMNEAKRKFLELPTAALTPVVSKARHLRSAVLTRKGWQELKSSDERIWLFRPSAKWTTQPRVKRYLRLDVSNGGCNRRAYKVSIRKPWYQTPMPVVPDAFLSGMSQHGPWLCINQTKRVNATNTLYVVTFASRSRRDWYMWALALLSSQAQRQIRRIGRRYADGLVKYEPGSLGKIELPKPTADADHEELYTNAVSALLSGKPSLAREIADSV